MLKKPPHRQRVLSDDEVVALWRAAGRLGYPAGPFYRLLLLTGVRLNELADAKWSELHPDLRRLMRDADGHALGRGARGRSSRECPAPAPGKAPESAGRGR